MLSKSKNEIDLFATINQQPQVLIIGTHVIRFILEGVDLLDHTSIFLLRTINHRVIPIIRILSWFVPTGTSSEFFPPEYPPHWDIPTRSLDIPLGYGLPRTRFKFKVLECDLGFGVILWQNYGTNIGHSWAKCQNCLHISFI